MKSQRSEVPDSHPDTIGTLESADSNGDDCETPTDSRLLDTRTSEDIRADYNVEEVSAAVQEFARKISRSKKSREMARILLYRRVNGECKRLLFRASVRNVTKNFRKAVGGVWAKVRR